MKPYGKGSTALLCFAFVLCLGCRGGERTADADLNTPEVVYRQFFLAILEPKEQAIRGLILDHPDAPILWQGSYPTIVADALRNQYQTMKITRVESNDPEITVLESSAVPIQLTVRRQLGNWKVDAGPLIELRKAANN